jgi:hypothetical protein
MFAAFANRDFYLVTLIHIQLINLAGTAPTVCPDSRIRLPVLLMISVH